MKEMRDAVEELIATEVAREPEAAAYVAAFESNEQLLNALAEARERAGVSQRDVARRMGTSASVVVHLEAGHVDPRLSTIARYAASLGKAVAWELVDVVRRPAVPTVPVHASSTVGRYLAVDTTELVTWDLTAPMSGVGLGIMITGTPEEVRWGAAHGMQATGTSQAGSLRCEQVALTGGAMSHSALVAA